MLAELLVAAAIAAPYRLITDYTRVPRHAKVCAVGTVVYRRKMQDGDWHVTVIDRRGGKLVLEIVPEVPLVPPIKGTRVLACGIGRYDTKHRWPEIHPVVRWVPYGS